MTAPREYKRDPKGSSTGGQFTVQESSAQTSPKTKKAKATAEPASRPSSARFKTLAPGEDNDPSTVKEMQQLLSALGLGKLAVDGKYGPATTEAVKAAQRKLGLRPTGKASKALVNKLLSAYDLSPCIKRSEDPDPTEIERGVPHPGQRYRHGWIPLMGLEVLGRTYTVQELEGSYGEALDNEEFAPGAIVELADSGDIHFDIADTQPNQYRVFADGISQIEAEEMAEDLDWAIDHQTGYTRKGSRPADSRNGLYDWQERNGLLVGYGPDDLIRIGRGEDDDFVTMDLSVDEARELMNGLNRLAQTPLPDEEEEE